VNGWTIFLLIADLAGVTVAAVASVRAAAADEAGRTLRGIRLAQVGLSGGLIAVVAFFPGQLGFGGVIGLVAMALVAGESLRYALLLSEVERDLGQSGWGPPALGTLSLVFTGAVLVLVWLAAQTPVPAPPGPNLDEALFRVRIFDSQAVPARALPGRPSLADAGVADGVAVPVNQYTAAGQDLTLEVSHDVTCTAATVLLGPDTDDATPVLDVVVVYQPGRLTPTAAPSGATDPSRCAAPGALTVHGLVEVTVPTGLPGSPVHDAGGGGAAKPAR
jgi:hypothetical protein